MTTPTLDEYMAFARLTDGLATAADGAKMVGRCRPDQRNQWDVVASTIEVVRQSCFQLASERAVKQ